MAKKKRKKGRRPSRPQGRPSAPRQAERRRADATSRPEARAEGEQPEGRGPEDRRGDERRRGAGAAGAATGAAISNRQARKEQARRERERRLRRARRQRRTRRIVRWAIALAVIGGIGFLIWYVNTRPLLLDDEQAAEAAAALGCGGGDGNIEEPGATGAAQHLAQGELPDYGSERPATSGRHSATTYTGPPVVEEAVTPSSATEANLVHNLEHAYVIMYYRADGDGALSEDAVDELTGIARDESKVLLAPYSGLEEGTSVAFTAWNKLLPCPEVGAGQADDLVTVARGFIEQYRGTNNAPEPAAG